MILLKGIFTTEHFTFQNTDHALMNATMQDQLQLLLQRAYNIQDHYRHKVLTQVNASVAMDSAITALTEMDRAYEEMKSKTASLHDDVSSDQDSFVSANEVRVADSLFAILSSEQKQDAIMCVALAAFRCQICQILRIRKTLIITCNCTKLPWMN